MLQYIYISDKRCSSELSIHQRNLEKIIFSIILRKAANQNIRLVSDIDVMMLKTRC